MLKALRALDCYLEDVLSVILYCYVVIIVFAEVVARYVLHNSILWSSETAIYAFIWLSYLSMAYLAKSRSHLAVTFIRDALPRPMQLALLLLSDLLLLVLASVIVIHIKLPLTDAVEFDQMMVAINLPFWIALAAVPVGWTLVAIRTVQRAWIAIVDFREGRSLSPTVAEAT